MNRNLRRTRRQAFTLIELMIVIAIIGVLAAIAVPNFQKARARANTRACYANQKTIAGGLEMYNLDKNTNSTDIPGIIPSLVTSGYLQSTPKDPGDGGASSETNYKYTPNGNGIFCNRHGTIQTSTP